MSSDANYSTLAAQKETAWAVPTAPPALKLMRITGESIQHIKDTVTSEEVRSDRQTSDIVEVGASASGGVDFELSYLAWQEWLEAALFSSIVTINASVTATFSAAGQTITRTAGDVTPFATVLPGCFVKVVGAANPLNNGAKLVLSKTDDVLTLAAGSIAADQAGAALTITGKHLKNGTERKSYSIERGILNNAGTRSFQVYRGMMVNTLDLSFESKAIVTGSIDFVGQAGSVGTASVQDVTGTAASGVLTGTGTFSADETVTIGARVYTFKVAVAAANQVKIGANLAASLANLAAAINAGAGAGSEYGTGTVAHAEVSAVATATTVTVTRRSVGVSALATTDTGANASWANATLTGGVNATPYTAANTDPVVNATSNVSGLRKDNVTLGERFKTLNLSINNNLRGLDCIGERGNFDVGVGGFDVTGSLSAYFKDNSLLADFIAHTYTGLSYLVTNGNGQTIGIHIPRLNFSTGGPMVEGKNSDVMQEQEFTAILSETYGATILFSFLD